MSPRTPEEVDALFAEHVNAGAIDALVGLYEGEASLVGRDGSVATGHAAIRESLLPLVEMKARITGRALEVVRRPPDGTWRFIADDPWARG